MKVLTGTNTKVGIAEGIQGTCQVLFAFPAGWLADRYRRDRVLKSSATIGMIAIISILFALYSSKILSFENDGERSEAVVNLEYILLSIGLGLWGVFVGSSNPPLEALYADSTTKENRPRVCIKCL